MPFPESTTMPPLPDLPAAEISPSRLQLPPGAWATLLDGLSAHFPRIGRERWRDRFARGRVQDQGGRPLTADAAYRVGMEVRYFREVEHEPYVPFTETLIHVDEHLVVADKPHFLPVTPAGSYVRETLLARLQQRLGNPQLAPLHRIDRGTAGLVLFSAQPVTRAAYQGLFAGQRIKKRYEALAPAMPELVFPLLHRSRLVPGEPFFRMREVEGVVNAVTRMEVLEASGPVWRYALYPVTGRKHQLRVHMAALGAPIMNDDLYPMLREPSGDDQNRPLKLLAQSLAFYDPLSGRERRFHSLRDI